MTRLEMLTVAGAVVAGLAAAEEQPCGKCQGGRSNAVKTAILCHEN